MTFEEKWLRLFEQLSPIYKWTPDRLRKVQSCPRRLRVACDGRRAAMGNSGYTEDFILSGQLHLRQDG